MPGMRARKHKITASEHDEQVALFQWAEFVGIRDKRLNLMFAIPNGGHRHPAVARKLQTEGVKPGIHDIFFPCPVGVKHGLWIEMKRKGGRATPEQRVWQTVMRSLGYDAEICEGFEEAKKVICNYLKQSNRIVESVDDALELVGVTK